MEMSNTTRVSRYGFVNCYLVREDDGLTLVDTMIPGSQKKILGAAERLGAPIKRIVLTHARRSHRLAGCTGKGAPGRRGDHLDA
jgi:glyoxylase-like metal-dependent hydrolase (beta-lactamase superfamily II)